MKTACQRRNGPKNGREMPSAAWIALTMYPPTISAIPEPKKLEAVKTLTGRASRLGLNKSASREKPAGVSTASPTPTIIRAKKSWA